MPYIGAGGVMGIALETVSGTYQAPTKYVPFNSETLKFAGEPQEHRPIRNTAGVSDVTPGNMSVEGDVEFPVFVSPEGGGFCFSFRRCCFFLGLWCGRGDGFLCPARLGRFAFCLLAAGLFQFRRARFK